MLLCCSHYRCGHAQPAKVNDGRTTPNKGFVYFLKSILLLYHWNVAILRHWWLLSGINDIIWIFIACIFAYYID